MVFSRHRDLECGGNAAALALFATDSSRGTSPRSNRSADSQSAAAGGALQMAFKMMHHLLEYKGVGNAQSSHEGHGDDSWGLHHSPCFFITSFILTVRPPCR